MVAPRIVRQGARTLRGANDQLAGHFGHDRRRLASGLVGGGGDTRLNANGFVTDQIMRDGAAARHCYRADEQARPSALIRGKLEAFLAGRLAQ